MSWSLVKRSLELCEDNPITKSKKVEEISSHKASCSHRSKKAAKQRRIAEQRQQEIKNPFASRKPTISALEKYQRNAPKDRTSDNLKLLKKIDKKRTPQEFAEKILSQHTKQLERRSIREVSQSTSKNKPQKTSAFSDEDFERLNKEWLKLY